MGRLKKERTSKKATNDTVDTTSKKRQKKAKKSKRISQSKPNPILTILTNSVSKKILLAFVVNVGLFIAVIILLGSNIDKIQTEYDKTQEGYEAAIEEFLVSQEEYNTMLVSVMAVQDTKTAVTKLVGEIQKYTNMKIIEALDVGASLKDEIVGYQKIMEDATDQAMGSEMNMLERRTIAFDGITEGWDIFLQGTKDKDIAMQGKGSKQIDDTRPIIEAQVDAFLTVELSKVDSKIEAIRAKADETQAQIDTLLKEAEAKKAELERATQLLNILAFAGLAITIILVLIVVRNITKGLKQISKNAGAIADGNLAVNHVSVRSQDEIGILAKAFGHMQDSLVEMVTNQKSTSEEIHQMADKLLRNVDENSQASEVVADAIGNMTEKMQHQEAEMALIQEQIQNVVEFTAQIGETSSLARDESLKSLEAASEGTRLIETFISNTGEVRGVINEASSAIENLIKVSTEMNNIMENMGSISGQTTLLSLNASIEAARAGSEGLGFAVVAQEIRKLAENSSDLNNDIGEMIKRTQDILSEVNRSMSSVREKLDEGDSINGQVTSAFTDIKETNKVVEVHNTSIDEKIEHLAALFSKIEKSASDTYNLVNENEKYSEDISASVEEQVASFSEIKSSVAHLTDLSKLSKESVDRFNL